MNADLQLLLAATVSISLLHTVTGPDHYVPFIALAKARNWSLSKTIFCTVACGLGHVASSLALGLVGAGLGWSFTKLSWLESVRGGLASWGLLAFGVIYTVWGVRQVFLNRPHKHFEAYPNGAMYVYEHRPGEVVPPQQRHRVTPWVLFIIFLLGPCEPLLPLLSYPAAQHSPGGMVLLVGIFTLFTLLPMVTMVWLGYYGYAQLKSEKLERYMPAIGGSAVLLCGVGMVFLGW